MTSSVYSNTNGFPLSNGKTLHMDLAMGELAPRVITVGAIERAHKIASLLDNGVFTERSSSRGFSTYNGTYKGTAISVVAIGMGISMMDFFVRESRAVVESGTKMAIVRFGTCGGLHETASVGSIVVADGSVLITRNPDAFAGLYGGASTASAQEKYHMTEICPADNALTALVEEQLQREHKERHPVLRGVNVTAESFYSSQGRIDGNFHDDNEELISHVTSRVPEARSMEMESFQLLHLAKCSKAPIVAAATAIVVSPI
jgi:uridine phosphorylase